MTKGYNKLTKKEKEKLQSLIDDIIYDAKEVRLDYEGNPSEISGSTIQINENSPFLDEEFKGDGWKRVIRGSVEEAISMIKKKDKNDTK